MKIFYKKDYKNAIERLEEQYRLVDELQTKCEKIEEEKRKMKVAFEVRINEIVTNRIELKEHIKKLQGAKGGLTKRANKLSADVQEKDVEIKRLNKELKETQKRLEESMTDKFAVKKLKPQKAPVTKSKLKSQMKPAVLKFIQEKEKEIN